MKLIFLLKICFIVLFFKFLVSHETEFFSVSAIFAFIFLVFLYVHKVVWVLLPFS